MDEVLNAFYRWRVVTVGRTYELNRRLERRLRRDREELLQLMSGRWIRT